jgi:hypothetical protein
MRWVFAVLLITLSALPLLPGCTGQPSGGQPASLPLDPQRAHFPSGGR